MRRLGTILIAGAAFCAALTPALAQAGHDMSGHDRADPAVKPLREAANADGSAKPADAPHAGHEEVRHSHDESTVPKTPTLLTGYGSGGFTITTSVPAAQAFFSNGMELSAAFAHKAAIAATTEAVRLDPDCAMCLWGKALVSGPTIN